MDKAVVRQHVEKIDGVSRTWFEWEYDSEHSLTKTLVVEVDFDTDPNCSQFRQNVLNAIKETVIGVLAPVGGETTMIVSHLKIIPRDQ
jgi:hypothetical protein